MRRAPTPRYSATGALVNGVVYVLGPHHSSVHPFFLSPPSGGYGIKDYETTGVQRGQRLPDLYALTAGPDVPTTPLLGVHEDKQLRAQRRLDPTKHSKLVRINEDGLGAEYDRTLGPWSRVGAVQAATPFDQSQPSGYYEVRLLKQSPSLL